LVVIFFVVCYNFDGIFLSFPNYIFHFIFFCFYSDFLVIIYQFILFCYPFHVKIFWFIVLKINIIILTSSFMFSLLSYNFVCTVIIFSYQGCLLRMLAFLPLLFSVFFFIASFCLNVYHCFSVIIFMQLLWPNFML
jgi:hypothetical protein